MSVAALAPVDVDAFLGFAFLKLEDWADGLAPAPALQVTRGRIPEDVIRTGPVPEGWRLAIWCDVELPVGAMVRVWTGTHWAAPRAIEEVQLDRSRRPVGLVSVTVASLEITEDQAACVAVRRVDS
ncbi:MAG: hypothetical protein AAGM22_27765 [Acidobacteriota bacterium]